MKKEDLEQLCNSLRSGEYDGKDIIRACIAIEKLAQDNQVLLEATKDYLSDTKNSESEISLWEVLTKLD